jgi:KUP system potassium uptake protein
MSKFDEFLKVLHEHIAQNLHSKLTLGGLLISLGIIIMILEPPLYVMKAILGTHTINADVVLGGISAVLTLTLQTTIKYVLL